MGIDLVSRDVEPYEFDVFVSHASEDKARFVEPLSAALRERGIRIWYDAYEIRLGDDFRRKMDEGLARSLFGVVVLSPSFFKYWPEAELQLAGAPLLSTANCQPVTAREV